MALPTKVTSGIKTAANKATQSASKMPSLPGTGEPLIGGVDFWLVAGFSLSVDIFQVAEALGHVFATSLMALTTIPVIGLLAIPISMALNFGLLLAGVIVGLTLSGTILLYCFFKKIPLNLLRIASQGATLLVEQIPLMNLLPFNVINIILLRFFENWRRRGNAGIVGKVASLAANFTPIGKVGKIASTIVK